MSMKKQDKLYGNELDVRGASMVAAGAGKGRFRLSGDERKAHKAFRDARRKRV